MFEGAAPSAPSAVDVSLADGEHFLRVEIASVSVEPDGAGVGRVVKDAGDDPDQTHRAVIVARVRPRTEPGLVFVAGAGVGTVTKPGLLAPVGEPAINPTPRRMIAKAVAEAVAERENVPPGFVIEIGCEGGEEIAKRTFNPRLGVEGGISILGTTGIVEPKSMASFRASIEVYIRVAAAESPAEIVMTPGNLGQRFARETLDLDLRRIVQMSNFVGFSLDFLEGELERLGYRLPRLWIVGHPGKLAKIAAGHWDTHSRNSPAATEVVAGIAAEAGHFFDAEKYRTVEGMLADFPPGHELWGVVAARVREAVKGRVTRVDKVEVVLSSMAGETLNFRR